MSEKDFHPAASHRAFPYYFTTDGDGNPIEGFWLTGIPAPTVPYRYQYDLAIYYDSLAGSDYIDCKCSRWDVQNYSVIVETWINKNEYQYIVNNIRPGAVGELYKILGKPLYYDSSWDGSNTLRLLPTPSSSLMSDSTLSKMRKETLIYPKNITTSPISEDWISLKIEGLISGSTDL
jgi:hypothetical protein